MAAAVWAWDMGSVTSSLQAECRGIGATPGPTAGIAGYNVRTR
jgi:hypothetical protein